MAPEFILATDLPPCGAAWAAAVAQVSDIRQACARVLGFEPEVTLASMPGHPGETEPAPSLRQAIRTAVQRDAHGIFVIPGALDFSLWQREALGQLLAAARRDHASVVIHHDDVDPGHPLVVGAFAERAGRSLAEANIPAQHCGLVFAPSGHGDPSSRAQSFRLMRLMWEELGLARGEVGFVRHAQPFLGHVLERCGRENLCWLVLPQSQWEVEHVAYARVILENFQRSHPESMGWVFLDPPGAHPSLTAWYAQRIVGLWRQKRDRERGRTRSVRNSVDSTKRLWNCGSGVIARVADSDALAETLNSILPSGKPERVLVKVTLHGYATGTYTDPAALDMLLAALPAPAIILEGHTSSRNLGSADFDWETQAREHRSWIRQQEAEYLRRTGIADVLTRHNAQYVNVTEAWWDEECACRCEIESVLKGCGVGLHNSEFAGFIPKELLRFRGCPFISFAKIKGPTRLSVSNMFGLIPAPLRDAWHGPNITWFARVCCDMAKLYGSLFEISGLVEGLFSAVRWNRQGLYRSRWGNYDLVRDAGYVAVSRGLVGADILASRLQGQDVLRSAFFDIVREELGWDSEAAEVALPREIEPVFA